ncbi:hypothetical protein AK812_SmicGene11828 [Symbiodinium microadriaticum]|uniref:Uncharacterized protein n=1 Tax=Symbiodinium microadriaticum TaxID=2951 RepID=A0A1Q9ECB0_SYMMI|nr:hypothetical protein AK812_SmicGene11828 [Symbiodinium microadriaticum]
MKSRRDVSLAVAAVVADRILFETPSRLNALAGRLSRAPSFPTTTSRSSCRLSPDPTHCKDLTKFSMKSTPAKRDKWI